MILTMIFCVRSEVYIQSAESFLSEKDPQSLDLVIAGDVLPYVGSVESIMRQAAQALRDGGIFALTSEELVSAHVLWCKLEATIIWHFKTFGTSAYLLSCKLFR